MSNLHFTNDVAGALIGIVNRLAPDYVIVLTDKNVEPLIANDIAGLNATMMAITPGEEHKNIDTLTNVWRQMTDGRLSRRSLMICIGGGVVTDLGGFAAATFKRGIRSVNVPTTLLAAVDASVGGKTGIDFQGLKNEIGAFHEPTDVVISSKYLSSLPELELLSGEAEMLKHAVIQGRDVVARLVEQPIETIDAEMALELIKQSVSVKQQIVAADPKEAGLRRVLNLGHTAGHALEEMAAESGHPVPHGIAVAHGLAIALIISRLQLGLESGWMHMMVRHIADRYPHIPLKCTDYDRIIELMRHDKKNVLSDHNTLNFSLVAAPGDVRHDCRVTTTTVRDAIDIYRDFIGN